MASKKLLPKTTISETKKNESSSSPENKPNVFEELLNVCGDDEVMAELIAELMAEENNQEMKQAPKKKSLRNPVKLVTKPSSKKVVKTVSKTGIKPVISGKKTISKVKTGTNCTANAISKSVKVSSRASLNKAPVHTVKKFSVVSPNSHPTSKAISAATVKPIRKVTFSKNIITASPLKKGPPVTAKKPNLSGTIMKKVMNTIPTKLIASKPTTAPAVKSVLRGTEKQTKPSAGLSESVKISGNQKNFEEVNISKIAPENKPNVFEELLNVCGDDEVMAELIAGVMATQNNQEMKQAPKKKSPRNPVTLVMKPSSKKVIKTISKTGIKPIISGEKMISKIKIRTDGAANASSKSAKDSSTASLNKAPVHTVKKISVESTNSQPTSKAISATTVKAIHEIIVAKNIITAPENKPNVFEELLNVCGDDEAMAELIAELMAEENNQEMKQAPKKKSLRNPVKLVTKPSSKKVVKTVSKTGIKPVISGKKTISKVKTGTNCTANAISKSVKVSSRASLNKAPVHTVKKFSVVSPNSHPTSKAISAATVKPIRKVTFSKNIITASPLKKGPPVTAKKPNLSGTIMKKVVNTIPTKLIASKPTTAPAVKSVLRGTEKQTKPSETDKRTSALSPFSMDTSATYIIQRDYSPMWENEDEEHTLRRYGPGEMDFSSLEIINEYIQAIDSKITAEDIEKARNSICP